jgi:hypothetical protein
MERRREGVPVQPCAGVVYSETYASFFGGIVSFLSRCRTDFRFSPNYCLFGKRAVITKMLYKSYFGSTSDTHATLPPKRNGKTMNLGHTSRTLKPSSLITC